MKAADSNRAERARIGTVNIVFISGFLSPDSKGGPALRAQNSLVIMKKLGHVQAFDLDSIAPFAWSGGATKQLASEAKKSFLVACHKTLSRALQLIEISTQLVSLSAYFRLQELIRSSSPDVVWFSFASQYPLLFLSLRRRFTSIPFVADTDAVISTHLARAAYELSGPRRVVYEFLAHRTKVFENKILREASVSTAVSKFDLDEYRKRSTSYELALFPNVISTDTREQVDAPKHAIPTVLITGTFGGKESAMTHGVLWFLREVLPEVLVSIPEIAVNIVGRNASRLREFVDIPPQVNIFSDVQSLSPFFTEAWCSVCPLFFESGTRFKILEAAARAVPTISTSLGCEGLEFEHARDILVANTREEFAGMLVRLIRDSSLRSSIGASSLETLMEKYSIDSGELAARSILERYVSCEE